MAYIYNLTDTWNSGATTFDGIKMNVTDTASAAGSRLLNLQIGGADRAYVDKSGNGYFLGSVTAGSIITNSALSASRLNLTDSVTGTASTSTIDAATTWNTTGTPTAWKLNVTDTASNANSLLMDLQVGGTSNFQVGKRGQITFKSRFGTAGASTGAFFDTRTDSGGGIVAGFGNGGGGWYFGGADQSNFTAIATNAGGFSSAAIGFGAGNVTYSPTQVYPVNYATAVDVLLGRDAADTLAQRRGTNAQSFRVYNTFTDASNYERGVMSWIGNDLKVGVENAGTGVSTRQMHLYSGGLLRFYTNGTHRWNIDASGNLVAAADNTYDIGASGASRPRRLYLGGGSLTGSAADSSVEINPTWNTTGTPTAVKLNVTDTASNANSLLMDLQVGGSSQFRVQKSSGIIEVADVGGAGIRRITTGGGLQINGSANLTLENGRISLGTNALGWSGDTFLTRKAAANLQLGNADAAAPVAQSLSVQSVVAGTTNVAGANFTINGSQGTGTGAGGAIILQTAAAGTSGSAQNALAERARLTPAGNLGVGTTAPDANGKVDILGNIDPGTTPAALSVRNTGVGGGAAVAQYGIRVSSQTYNNATASYGVYAFSYQNTGNATYGVWGDAGSSSLVGNSSAQFYGVVGRAYFNSAASHTLTNGNLPVGVYGTVVSTGSTNTAISAAGYFTNAATFGSEAYGIYVNVATGPTTTIAARFDFAGAEVARIDSAGGILSRGTGGIGYRTGAGGTVTQATSRTTGVTLNTVTGSITLVSAAGTTAWQSFTVTNSTIAANDTVIVNQRSGTDLYMIHVTNVAAGSFRITFATTGGTTTEQPVFNFAVIKGATS